MGQSSKANRINVKNLKYTVIIEDTETSFTTGEIKNFAKAMQVQITPTVATGTLYGDGAKQEDLAKLTGVTLQVDANKIPIEVKAEVNGNKYENGVLQENKDDQPKDIAVGFEVEQTNNKRELIWLYKGKVQPFANTVQQATDNINFSTDTLTINFIPRELDGNIRAIGDTANAEFTDVMADTFLTKVPGSTNTTEEG